MAFDPESGLTLTTTFSVGATISSGDVDRANSVVLALDLTGLDGSSGGLIHEQGGQGVGSYIGFRPNGSFIARCGDGILADPGDGSTTPSAAVLIVSAAGAPSGDGTLVVEFDESAGSGKWEVTAWWNGTELTGDVRDQVADGTDSDWAGTNSGEYLTTSGNLAKYDPGTGLQGEVETPVTYTTASGLRYYENQVVTATPSSSVDLTADDVASAASVSSPVLGQQHGLTASAVSSASSVATPGIGQVHDLGATGAGAASSVSVPVVGQAHALSADSVFAQSGATAAALGQVHALTAADVSAAPGVSAPAISTGGADALAADNVQAASSVSSPSIGQAHSLTANGVSAGSGVSAPAISVSGADALAADSVAAASGVSAPSIGQTHSLAALGLSAQPQISVPVLGQVHGLSAAGLSSASAVSLPVLRDLGAITYFYSTPEDSGRGGTLISPTRGGTLLDAGRGGTVSRHEV